MATEYYGSGNDDGEIAFRSGGKGGFYGLATAIVQPTMTATAVTAIGTTTLSQVATSGKWAFASSTAGKAIVTRVDQLQVDVENLLTKLNALNLIDVAGV